MLCAADTPMVGEESLYPRLLASGAQREPLISNASH